ncbi:MAG: hypothetical protein M3460_28390 [Actinomycetota bacterium]|nr:hypothetical protein [Actinomycetota bacterium]
MRILNRLIAAGALIVPMGLGVSGVAVADVAAGSPVPPTQIGTPEDGSKPCEDKEDKEDKKDSLLGGLLGGLDNSDDGKCRGKDRDNGKGLPH